MIKLVSIPNWYWMLIHQKNAPISEAANPLSLTPAPNPNTPLPAKKKKKKTIGKTRKLFEQWFMAQVFFCVFSSSIILWIATNIHDIYSLRTVKGQVKAEFLSFMPVSKRQQHVKRSWWCEIKGWGDISKEFLS